MRLYQKIIVGVLAVISLIVAAATVYGMQAIDDANSMMNNISKTLNRKSSKREQAASIENRDPFSILLLGVDTGALGRTEKGRSDSMMVVTVNPQKEETTIVSLDRDIMADMLDDGQTFDKMNHAYAYGGEELAMDAAEKLLDIPIDHFVTINMQGLRDLIDAVGGITVNNKIAFTLEGVRVPKGKVKLNGKNGLAYARMRKQDPDGDIGRQKRQREVLTKIVEKVISMDSVTNYKKILKAVEKNSQTDLTWDDLLDIASNYYPAFEKVNQEQLQGQSQLINDIYYQILGENELLTVQNKLKKQLNLPTSDTLKIDPQNEYSQNGLIANQFYDDSEGGEGLTGDTSTSASEGTVTTETEDQSQYQYQEQQPEQPAVESQTPTDGVENYGY
ncbi:MAG TPA: LCP family protein [Tetragenococcus sp.]|nr:LCP family protein [Tetragenococcus sp.]